MQDKYEFYGESYLSKEVKSENYVEHQYDKDFNLDCLQNADELKREIAVILEAPEITFGVYNSSTKQEDEAGIAEYGRIFKDENGHSLKPLPNEAISRKTMQKTPPHILVTNYAMEWYEKEFARLKRKGDIQAAARCERQLKEYRRKEALKVISRTVDKYRAANYPYEEICILTLKTENGSILNGVEKIGNHQIRTERDGKGVLFTTARKFKGLESDVIIIVDVDDKSFVDDESKRLFYVGCSRAKHQLDILFVGDEDMLKNAGKSLSDQNFPNARIGIARCLNVKPIVAKE